MEFVSAYGAKRKTRFNTTGPSMARQSMAQECDINFIMDKYARTGVIEHQRRYQGDYGDFESIDLHTAMNAIANAQEMFMSLPAAIRKEFQNDPEAFVEFAQNPENQAKMAEWGLAAPPAEEAPTAPVEPPAAAPEPAAEPAR